MGVICKTTPTCDKNIQFWPFMHCHAGTTSIVKFGYKYFMVGNQIVVDPVWSRCDLLCMLLFPKKKCPNSTLFFAPMSRLPLQNKENLLFLQNRLPRTFNVMFYCFFTASSAILLLLFSVSAVFCFCYFLFLTFYLFHCFSVSNTQCVFKRIIGWLRY